MDQFLLSPLAKKLIQAIKHSSPVVSGERVSVNPVVSDVASFYEKIRNAMEYQEEEEVVFRSAIERILRRKLLFKDDGERVAESLVRELAWAKYFPDNTIPESIVDSIAKDISLYIRLFREAVKKHHLNREKLASWMLQVMSSDIAFRISPNRNTQIISNFMFHIFQKKITLTERPEDKGETTQMSEKNSSDRDALVFLSVKRALAKEDKAFLRYDLFNQYFGDLTEESFHSILNSFVEGYQKIERTFDHPLNDQMFTFIKRRAIPFIILRDVFNEYKENIDDLVLDENLLSSAVVRICEKRYKEIGKKVRTAIVRSVIFLFATKAIIAIVLESNLERLIYHHTSNLALIMNISAPPLLMLSTLLFIKTPDRDNSYRINRKIRSVLFDEHVSEIEEKNFALHSKKNPILYGVFILLWLAALYLVISRISMVLSLIHMSAISQVVFVFFIVIVSFLTFRINQSSKAYNQTKEKENFRSVLFDFFFMPFIQLGRRITLTFSSINILLILFDFIIETPFKTIFAFLEQWFSFLRAQREILE